MTGYFHTFGYKDNRNINLYFILFFTLNVLMFKAFNKG